MLNVTTINNKNFKTLTDITGNVSKLHEKYSKNIMTSAW